MIYFDLGNVLLFFDHRQACRNMSRVSGVDAERIWEIVFAGDLQWAYERGDISREAFYESFCEASGTRPDFFELDLAASDIFTPNTCLIPLLAQLKTMGRRLGILSNTNLSHWEFVRARFAELLEPFEFFALSFQLQRLKPEPEIYERAAELAGSQHSEITFIDDRPENIAAAAEHGWNAHLFQDAGQVARLLDCASPT